MSLQSNLYRPSLAGESEGGRGERTDGERGGGGQMKRKREDRWRERMDGERGDRWRERERMDGERENGWRERGQMGKERETTGGESKSEKGWRVDRWRE